MGVVRSGFIPCSILLCVLGQGHFTLYASVTPLAKGEKQHKVVLWAFSVHELFYLQVSKTQILNSFMSALWGGIIL